MPDRFYPRGPDEPDDTYDAQEDEHRVDGGHVETAPRQRCGDSDAKDAEHATRTEAVHQALPEPDVPNMLTPLQNPLVMLAQACGWP
ncbi:hypothetical protein GCM10010324_21990 [Streptomyces hiroshimensis]|uniref:Uncharacterized protein n=1 Tax=Streptomyces hiroshimensis TaxID=66424 RepID=A0ABQ2Y9L5_9ACTN|nr:hypothetical protein GCM10010324_21990 [Streptomyces hiroshimensis]